MAAITTAIDRRASPRSARRRDVDVACHRPAADGPARAGRRQAGGSSPRGRPSPCPQNQGTGPIRATTWSSHPTGNAHAARARSGSSSQATYRRAIHHRPGRFEHPGDPGPHPRRPGRPTRCCTPISRCGSSSPRIPRSRTAASAHLRPQPELEHGPRARPRRARGRTSTARGRPNHFDSVTIDVNSSSGVYVEGFSQG